MQHEIKGTTMPVLEVSLAAGEQLVAESGELSWLTPGIELQTSTGGGASGGGLFGALKRAVAGGTLFMTEYTAHEPGLVAFAAKVPGHIVPVTLEPGRELLVHRHGFLCATGGVSVQVGFQQSFRSGLFGGEGFILQRLSGEGQAFVELSGEVIEQDLAPGQELRVHPGHVGMFEAAVSFELTTIPGVRNRLFGSDGLFLARLVGPGRLWLQTMPLPNLAAALSPYLQPEEKSS
jgi:uncharacterized protein (TIGR00266 family)